MRERERKTGFEARRRISFRQLRDAATFNTREIKITPSFASGNGKRKQPPWIPTSRLVCHGSFLEDSGLRDAHLQ